MKEGDIARYIKQLHLPKDLYLGIFPYKKVPKTLKCNQFVVLHRYIKKTGHWFCLVKTFDNEVEIFDSVVCPQSVKKFIAQRLQCSVTSNSTRLQGKTSQSCGLFCIYYAFNRIFNLDLLANDFIADFFSATYKENERFLKEFAKDYSLQ